ncbi:response regulator, partial [Okeania sp. SIO2B9]|uniref:ATP-binding response regulator n=1 Tax=Okeania sp. SIO2B9 TaxID=2607782 RepID=UPI00142962EE
NYRALPTPSDIAQTVSLSELIAGKVNPDAIANRIVFIGVTENSATDHWALCEMMGGKMWFESQEGIGSTFYFTLIVKVDENVKSQLNSIPKLGKKRLLIVDDNPSCLQILTKQLSQWGILAHGVASGVEAIDLLQHENVNQNQVFDLIIIDMQMPEMNGVATATAIRELPKYQSLPLVMLTPIGKSPEKNQLQKLNLAALLNKPIKQSQLQNILQKIFSQITINS